MLQHSLFLHNKLQQWLTLPLVTTTNTTKSGACEKCLWEMVL